jgi:hypothetical protein
MARAFTRPPDGRNAKAHLVARGIAPASSRASPRREETTGRWTFRDDFAECGSAYHIRSLPAARVTLRRLDLAAEIYHLRES